jgi:hypothetical protein
VPQVIRRGGDDRAQLVARLGAGPGSAALHDPQQAQRLDRPVVRLRGRRRLTGEHRPSRGDRIDDIGLPVPAADLPVRPGHLDDPHLVLGQVPGQRGSVAARFLDPDREQHTERPHPAQQPPIAGRRSREAPRAEHAAEVVHGRRHMIVQMCVDAARDRTWSGVIVVMSALLVAGQGRARRGRRRTGQGRACSRRLLLGHSPKVRARCSPARSTNRLEGSH